MSPLQIIAAVASFAFCCVVIGTLIEQIMSRFLLRAQLNQTLQEVREIRSMLERQSKRLADLEAGEQNKKI